MLRLAPGDGARRPVGRQPRARSRQHAPPTAHPQGWGEWQSHAGALRAGRGRRTPAARLLARAQAE